MSRLLKHWPAILSLLLTFALGLAVASLDRCDVRDRKIETRAGTEASVQGQLEDLREDLDQHVSDAGELVKEWRKDQREFRNYFAVMITWMRMVSPALKAPPPEIPSSLRQACTDPDGPVHAPGMCTEQDPRGILAATP